MAQRRGAQRRSSGDDREGGDFGDDGEICDCWDVDGIGMDKRHKCCWVISHEKINLSVNITNTRIDEEKNLCGEIGGTLGSAGESRGEILRQPDFHDWLPGSLLIIMIDYRDHW